VAPRFGTFTVAVNAKPWSITRPVVTDLVISRNGERVAALGNTDNRDWSIMVDGGFWDGKWDMAWAPVISADGRHVAVKVERAGRQSLVVDNRVYPREFAKVWDPTFSPDGTKMLIRAMDKDAYVRIVVTLGQA
jgi:hypothetical protein